MKKRTLYIITCLLLASFFTTNKVSAQVNFEKIEFDLGLKKALHENKYIFIDAYTGWCGFCVQLDTKTFRDSAISAFMNQHFIAIKMNMEEEEWGIKIARKYVITTFPSGIIFNGDGRLMGIITGYSDAKTYLGMINDIINNKDSSEYSGYSKSYNIKYHRIYLESMNKKGSQKYPENSIVNSLLQNQQEKFSKKNWVLWKRFPSIINNSNTNYFLENISKFRLLYGNRDVKDIVNSFALSLVDSAISAKNIEILNKVTSIIDNYLPENKALKTQYLINYFKGVKDWDNYAKTLNNWISNNHFSKEILHHYAMDLYYSCDNNKLIEYSIKWNEKAIQIDSSYKLLYSQALFYYKINEYEEALKYLKLSINVGISKEMNIGDAEELQRKISQQIKN